MEKRLIIVMQALFTLRVFVSMGLNNRHANKY